MKSPIASEEDYPYTSGLMKTGKCHTKKEAKGTVKLDSHKAVESKSVAAIKAAVEQQPTCVSVDAEG